MAVAVTASLETISAGTGVAGLPLKRPIPNTNATTSSRAASVPKMAQGGSGKAEALGRAFRANLVVGGSTFPFNTVGSSVGRCTTRRRELAISPGLR